MKLKWGYLFSQLRRIPEHRREEFKSRIEQSYHSCMASMTRFLEKEYEDYGVNGKLGDSVMQRARLMEEFARCYDAITPEKRRMIQGVVEQVYQKNYQGLKDTVAQSIPEKRAWQRMEGTAAARPAVIQATVENDLDKMKLDKVLEGHRETVIDKAKQELTNGLINGDRPDTMAEKLEGVLEKDFAKAKRVVRTEAHRNKEAGSFEAMLEADRRHKEAGTGYRYYKTWETAKDERVRPGRGIGKKAAGKADHKALQGVCILIEEEFDLGNGVKALYPGGSGDAGNDIHCRCRLTYRLVEGEEKTDESEPVLLTPEQAEVYKRAEISEPAITSDIKQIVNATGADLGGLKYRLKTKESFVRKVETDIKEKQITEKQALSQMYDIVRFTQISGADSLVADCRNTIELLEQKGYNIVRVKNTWVDPFNAYKGINTVVQSANGQYFELQYHKRESFVLKNGPLHKLYEIARTLSLDDPKLVEIEKQMLELSKNLAVPKNIGDIK